MGNVSAISLWHDRNKNLALVGLSRTTSMSNEASSVPKQTASSTKSTARGLHADGTYLMNEYNASDKLEQNSGLRGSFMYSVTTSLASGGVGLGTAGLPQTKGRELCSKAGFNSVHRLAVDDAFSALYVIRQ